MKLLILLIGLILILEGLPYVAAPEGMRNWLKKLSEMDPGQLRSMGLVAMAGMMSRIGSVLRLAYKFTQGILWVLETWIWIVAHPILSVVAAAVAAVIIYGIAYVVWHALLRIYYWIRPY